MSAPPGEGPTTSADEAEGRLHASALILARTPDAMSALIAGVPVPRTLLRSDILTKMGEPLEGPDYTLDDAAALQVELVRSAIHSPLRIADQPANGASAEPSAQPLIVLPLADFLQREYPPPDPLLGDAAHMLYLARGTFLLLYGDGGAGKSTLTIDAIAHLAAGRDWLGIPTPRPCKILLIENEGSASLYQAKLADKAAHWDADKEWLENVYVYTEPWSRFTFSDAHMREEIRVLSMMFEIDLIVANPLFGVGGPGGGKPEETSLFVEWLKEIGLWNGGPAMWLLHHENKLGQVSGDWSRQPDTTISLERDGDAERTILNWEKVRWVGQQPEGWQRKQFLNWIGEHKGYEPIAVDLTVKATDDELFDRLEAFLITNPWKSTKQITDTVQGNSQRLRNLLKDGCETGVFHSRPAKYGATLYSTDPNVVLEAKDDQDDLDLFPHEQRDEGSSSTQDDLSSKEDPTVRSVRGRPPSPSSPVRGEEEDDPRNGRPLDSTEETHDPDADIPF